jgi:hypothetical protein
MRGPHVRFCERCRGVILCTYSTQARALRHARSARGWRLLETALGWGLMCLTAPMKCRADCFCVVAAALRFLSVGTAIAARSTASEPARKMPAARTNGKLGGRYQATPRGRAMHAARSRRYRARVQCVTDHSPANEQKAGPFLELEVGEALSKRSRSRRSPLQSLCHHC